MYTIRTVVKMTGVPAHTIRAWERRFALFDPARSDTNRRLYTEDEVEHLRLLHAAIARGHTIGQLSKLDVPRLRELVQAPPAQLPSSATILDQCKRAVLELAPEALEMSLRHSLMESGASTMIEKTVIPLVHWIGECWRGGIVSISQEHMASAAIRSVLHGMLASVPRAPAGPTIVLTTLPGEEHELGLLIVGVIATTKGWNPILMGANMPVSEIAAAARATGARAIGLSLVNQTNDAELAGYLRQLRESIGQRIAIIVGGTEASAHAPTLNSVGVLLARDLASTEAALSAASRP